MPQQINLLTPILLAPKRYFSALTLLQAAALMLLVGLAAAFWLQQRERRIEAEHQALMAQYAEQRQQLQVAQAGLPAPQDPTALQQQLQQLEAGNAQRRGLLVSLGRDGTAPVGQRHSDVLALLARSLPDTAWVTEVRYAPGRLEVAGGTLNTAVLRPWLGQVAAHPLLAGQELTALRVDRVGATAGDASPLFDRSGATAPSGLPVWSFRVVSSPVAASAPQGVAR